MDVQSDRNCCRKNLHSICLIILYGLLIFSCIICPFFIKFLAISLRFQLNVQFSVSNVFILSAILINLAEMVFVAFAIYGLHKENGRYVIPYIATTTICTAIIAVVFVSIIFCQTRHSDNIIAELYEKPRILENCVLLFGYFAFKNCFAVVIYYRHKQLQMSQKSKERISKTESGCNPITYDFRLAMASLILIHIFFCKYAQTI